jgi:hypothetical protein
MTENRACFKHDKTLLLDLWFLLRVFVASDSCKLVIRVRGRARSRPSSAKIVVA